VAEAPTLRADAPQTLEQAWAVIREGGLLIYPTDTLYALGGNAWDGSVARRVRRAKGREEGKPLPVIARDLDQVKELCRDFPPDAALLADAFWPGPLTLVLAVAPAVPEDLTGGVGSVAVRIPAHGLARDLCALGPLISTSANHSGEPAPLTCAQALGSFRGTVALAVDGGAGRGKPSTLVDLTGPRPREVRAGAVAWPEIERVLHGRRS
jgi:L-threonylcarbamoyladenylate synthase